MAMISSLLLWAACASHRPVLSSNAYLTRVGPDVAEADINECMRRAEAPSNGRETPKENVVAGTAASTAVGAAAGAAGGAVVGQAGQGAAAGAAGGAVASVTYALVRALFTPSKASDVTHMAFVERCLREKGYEPAGWK